jgi:hypothetical protein
LLKCFEVVYKLYLFYMYFSSRDISATWPFPDVIFSSNVFGLFSGVRDENDHAYNPKIVRIGLKEHHSVRAVSMDYLVCIRQL